MFGLVGKCVGVVESGKTEPLIEKDTNMFQQNRAPQL
jgi:hypothetical protein